MSDIINDQSIPPPHLDDDDIMDIEEDKDQQQSLPPHLQNDDDDQQQQQIEDIPTTDEVKHSPTDIKYDSLYLRGVEELNTRDIKLYLDKLITPNLTFKNKDEYIRFKYKINWINDDSINIVFEHEESVIDALKLIIKDNDDITDLKITVDNNHERECKDYFNSNGELIENIKLFTRFSLFNDQKVKNSKNYSRYYLIHGEPNEFERGKRYQRGNDTRRRRGGNYRNDDDDLLVGSTHDDNDNDGRSGLFGYDGDVDDRRYHQRSNQSEDYYIKDRWRSDLYNRLDKNRKYNNNKKRNTIRVDRQQDQEDDLFPNLLNKRDNSRSRSRSRSRSPKR
ncbi:hypothetical protein CANARDRAFT_19316 [[Candida] arabinofermentans NRRL YB-2248]|uniref:Uncharacterized protein n=1 Tax=[Candida] arabinofermentans NRRL YB-2248 TaxID=983967 RepID=A0A1E4SVR9_9ASCO|nr:hypothetical protein CANARDRAFT_19316 [[Candida] arabinofermentans NRRL YB-2248]